MLASTPWTWAGRLPMVEAIAANLAAAEDCRIHGHAQIVMFEPEAPVFTLGRRALTPAGRAELAPTIALCAQRDIPVIAADRGGLGTLHLPGQLVCFVARPCRRSRLPALVDRLLRAALEVALELGLNAELRSGEHMGIWLPQGKLASIGLRLDRGVICHGMSVNVAVDRDLAHGLSLCGHVHTRLANLVCAGDRTHEGAPSGVESVQTVARRLAAGLDLAAR